MNDDNSVSKYNLICDNNEVFHSTASVFNMYYPTIIRNDKRTAHAQLGWKWIAPEDSNRKTELCGEEFPELEEVELYYLK